MPKYWGKQIFTQGSIPEVGQKQKTEREKKKKYKPERDVPRYALQRHLVWRTQSLLGQFIPHQYPNYLPLQVDTCINVFEA